MSSRLTIIVSVLRPVITIRLTNTPIFTKHCHQWWVVVLSVRPIHETPNSWMERSARETTNQAARCEVQSENHVDSTRNSCPLTRQWLGPSTKRFWSVCWIPFVEYEEKCGTSVKTNIILHHIPLLLLGSSWSKQRLLWSNTTPTHLISSRGFHVVP